MIWDSNDDTKARLEEQVGINKSFQKGQATSRLPQITVSQSLDTKKKKKPKTNIFNPKGRNHNLEK